ncbi:MAG: NAD-binding protein, partial [Lysobacterales bacterium]
DAALIIVTLDDFQATEQVVSSLHRIFPKLNILARGHDMEHCKSLQAQGARLAVSENLEASIALAESALSQISDDDAKNDAAIDRYRKNYY